MSINKAKALFIIDNNDNNYEKDPAIIRAQENLALAEKVQQEQMEQKRLERAQRQAEAEV